MALLVPLGCCVPIDLLLFVAPMSLAAAGILAFAGRGFRPTFAPSLAEVAAVVALFVAAAAALLISTEK